MGQRYPIHATIAPCHPSGISACYALAYLHHIENRCSLFRPLRASRSVRSSPAGKKEARVVVAPIQKTGLACYASGVLAVQSRLDPTVASALRRGRRARERDAAAKLSLLRRLQRQHVLRDLPLAERKTEQSFNEQLFSGVLGYQTLLSHDEMPFHLLPQLHAGGNYADFSLGYFGGPKDDVVLASGELKGSDADLDAPQRGKSYAGRSAVAQAFVTARAHASCRWVVVSNFRELRLYDIRNDVTPIAVAHLDQIVSRDDLASLCAHFDRAALLGAAGEEPQLVIATDPASPRAPLRVRDGTCQRA